MIDEKTMCRTPVVPECGDAAVLRARIRELEAQRDALSEQMLELQRAAEAGLMTAGLAHDLRNQLAALIGSAEVGLTQARPEVCRERLEACVDQGFRMHETLESFVQFIRRQDDREREFPVSLLMESLERLVSPVARGEHVSFRQTCTTNASLRADRQLVAQVLANLAMNGVRAASPAGGRVVLTASDGPDGDVCFVISDTGPGIDREVKARLFEPFVSTNHDAGGTGLGLYVVRQIVRRYGGSIEVDSGPAGTRFEVRLPVAVA